MQVFKPMLLGVLLGASLPAVAEDATTVPTYDCTAEETAAHIRRASHGLFAPAPISSPSEFKKAHAEAETKRAEAAGEESCVSIFSDGRLSDEWERMVKDIREFELDISFSGVDGAKLKMLLDKAKKYAKEKAAEALQKLGEDICNLVSTDNLKEMLLDSVNERYGISAGQLRLDSFANELSEKVLLDADNDVLMLLSEQALKDEVDSEVRDELRTLRSNLWDNL
jgi:hypothetical protein